MKGTVVTELDKQVLKEAHNTMINEFDATANQTDEKKALAKAINAMGELLAFYGI